MPKFKFAKTCWACLWSNSLLSKRVHCLLLNFHPPLTQSWHQWCSYTLLSLQLESKTTKIELIWLLLPLLKNTVLSLLTASVTKPKLEHAVYLLSVEQILCQSFSLLALLLLLHVLLHLLVKVRLPTADEWHTKPHSFFSEMNAAMLHKILVSLQLHVLAS